MPDYTLYALPDEGGTPVPTPEGATTTLEGRVMSPEGVDMGEARYVMSLAPRPKEELRQLVYDIVDGRSFTAEQVPADLVSMVFMPILFGALSPPDVLGEEPVPPVLPSAPVAPTRGVGEHEPPAPLPPEYHAVSAKVVEDFDWGLLDADDLREAKANVEVLNAPLRLAHAQAVEAWPQECEAVRARNIAREDDFVDAQAQYEAAKAAWEVECARLNQEHALRTAGREQLKKRVFSLWMRDFGTIVGDMADAGPRAINGYPILSAFRFIRRDEWAKVYDAVTREWERRKSDTDLFGDNSP